MKTRSSSRILHGIVLAAVALAFASVLSPCAQAKDENLLIRRAPNFGSNLWLEIWIDGELADKGIAYGHDFSAHLSPGHHTIGVRPRPTRWHFPPNRFPVEVLPGRTYEFMAFYNDNRAVLKPVHH
jgi:hypothetical protein